MRYLGFVLAKLTNRDVGVRRIWDLSQGVDISGNCWCLPAGSRPKQDTECRLHVSTWLENPWTESEIDGTRAHRREMCSHVCTQCRQLHKATHYSESILFSQPHLLSDSETYDLALIEMNSSSRFVINKTLPIAEIFLVVHRFGMAFHIPHWAQPRWRLPHH